MKLEVVRHDTRCAVCWGTLKKVKVVSPCLHRFCTKCIEEHLRKLCVRPPPRRPGFPIFFPSARQTRRRPGSLGDRRLTCALAPLPQQQLLSHVSRARSLARALREDPDFDAVVTALYADAKDYDLREHAYSAHVAKKTMQEDKEERERERAAKKRRMEEAAAQAAAMREQYRLEAEAKRRADEEAAAARAAKEAEERRATEQRAAAAEAAKAAAAAAKTPKSTAGKNTIDKRPPGRPRSSSAADPASNGAATTTKPGVAVEMPDDFAGSTPCAPGTIARAPPRAISARISTRASPWNCVVTRWTAASGFSRGRTSRAPGSAPVGAIKKLVARDAGTAVSAVRLTAGDGAEEDLDPSITVRDALYAQLQAGERELTLRYSVV